MTAAVVLIALGVLWGLMLLGVPIRWEWLLPGALIAIGVALLVTPRSRAGGLVGLGIAILIVAIVLLPARASLSGELADRAVTVEAVDQLEDAYELGVGQLTLDLRQLDIAPGETVQLTASVGIGELRVRLPEDAEVTGVARAGIGEVRGLEGTRGGFGVDVELRGDPGDGAEGPGGTLELDLQVGIGAVRASR